MWDVKWFAMRKRSACTVKISSRFKQIVRGRKIGRTHGVKGTRNRYLCACLNGPILHTAAEASAAAKPSGYTRLDAVFWSTKGHTPRMRGSQQQPRPPSLVIILVAFVAFIAVVSHHINPGFALALVPDAPTPSLPPPRASLLEPPPLASTPFPS